MADRSMMDLLFPAFYKLGLISDYVVEEGKSGIWTYRKWSNGIAECWGMVSLGDINLASSMTTGVYSSSSYSNRSQALPSGLFTKIEYVNANVKSNGYQQTQVCGYGENSISYRVWSSYPAEPTSVVVSLEAKGRWK